MWVQRTTAETEKWRTAAASEAHTGGMVVAGVAWLVLTIILAGGWIAGGRVGVVAEQSVAPGNFWARLPIFAVLGLPVAYWIYRRERRKELERSAQMTICPKCEIAGEGNADAACECGGKFVLQSSMRWIDDDEIEKQQRAG